ncbi:MAG: alanine--glyoxylate aminotransferase family protein [Actinomycetales bacterium]|nr:alanine--glyoxylate aminotransferase family protein [Actinomycetales bacterium]
MTPPAPIPGPIDPPARLLMGPGPITVDPRVLRAMSAQLTGQYDPYMTSTMGEVQELYRDVFRTRNAATLLVDGTSRAGIEAVLVSLLAPGDRVLVPIFGRFGHLLAEISERCGAEVHRLEREWGTVFPASEIEAALREVRPKVLAVVHGDTSTTLAQPLDELGALAAAHGALFYTDATASLGGNAFHADAWGLDAASTGLQKCLAGPSGSAPLTLSEAAVDVIAARSRVEEGIRPAGAADDGAGEADAAPIASNYFDLGQILKYWGPERLNHHTEATTMLYGARECARILLEEGDGHDGGLRGVDAAVARHALHGAAMTAGLLGLGFELFGDQSVRMNNVIGVRIPEGVDGDAGRAALLRDYGVEIGTSFGPLHGKVWRIGVMGYNARRDAVLTTLAALEQLLRRAGVRVAPGGGVDAALGAYADAGTAA